MLNLCINIKCKFYKESNFIFYNKYTLANIAYNLIKTQIF